MMKFVALFALCCLVGNAIARDVTHAEAIAATRRGGDLEGLNLEVLEDRKPVVRTRAPFEDLDLGATGRPATRDETVEPDNSHHGIGSGHDAEPEVSSTTGLPVVTDEVTSAANSEPTEATSVPVTGSDRTDAPATDKPATDRPATDKPATDKPATAESSSAEPSSAEPSSAEPASATSTDSSNDSTTTEESNTGSNTDAPTTSESSNTDSSNTNTPTDTTDSSNTEPTTDPTGEGNGGQSEKPKGLSTASISAIVIGGVLALAVIVAVAMAVVRRRRMAPERRGILDA